MLSKIAVETLETSNSKFRRTEAARAKKAANRGSVTDDTIEENTIDKERVPKGTPKKLGSRLPDDWQPSTADQAYAINLGLPWQRIAEDFRDYWLSKAGAGATKTDWSLTWQVWCRREADKRGPVQEAKPPSWGL